MNVKFLVLFFYIVFLNHGSSQDLNKAHAINPQNFNPDTIANRLERLNAKTPFELYFTPEVEKKIKSYLKNRVVFYKKNADKINFYLPLFLEHLQNKNIPQEIKYLPLIESILDPTAVSKVGATGLWQLMFYTALENGLTINSYVDQRMDPLKSTIAATNYLEKLYKIHSDWNLVLASYNAGPRTISKAIKRSGGHTNYWNLRPFLPSETANYVPSFIATMYILEYAEEHGIDLSGERNSFVEIDTIMIKQKIAFKHISKFLDFPEDSIKKLNPSYIHHIVPGKNKNSLVLPQKIVDKFIEIRSKKKQLKIFIFRNNFFCY